MRRILKWTGISLGSLVILILVVAVVLYVIGNRRLESTYAAAADALRIPTDAATVARGRHLATSVTLCVACHGDDLGGTVMDRMPLIATLVAPNLTSGRGGLGAGLTDADIVRAVRHGVGPDGHGLMVMHSDLFNHLARSDLVALVAFVRSVPPVDHELPATHITPLGRSLVALGMFDQPGLPLIPAERIDQSAPIPPDPVVEPSAGYGKYLMSVAMCTLCHGPRFRGGPPIEPGHPPAPDITSSGALGKLSLAGFTQVLRTGVTPSGSSIDPEFMPWDRFSGLSDEELTAIYAYLGSLSHD